MLEKSICPFLMDPKGYGSIFWCHKVFYTVTNSLFLSLLIPLFDNRNMDPQTCNLLKLSLILGAESNKFYPDLFKTATNSILAEGSFMET